MKARAVAVVITCVVSNGMIFFSTLPVRLQRRGHIHTRYAARAVLGSTLIGAVGAACAGFGIYCAVDEAQKANADGLRSPAFDGFAVYFTLSQALPLVLDLLKWMGCVYVFAPTWFLGYNTRKAVDCYFVRRPFVVPRHADLEQEDVVAEKKGADLAASAASAAAGGGPSSAGHPILPPLTCDTVIAIGVEPPSRLQGGKTAGNLHEQHAPDAGTGARDTARATVLFFPGPGQEH